MKKHFTKYHFYHYRQKLEISAIVSDIVLNCLEIELDQAIPTASFAGNLEVESLGWFELVLALKKAFSIEIYDEIAGTLSTVQQLVNYATSYVQNKIYQLMNSLKLAINEVVKVNNLNHFFGKDKLKRQILFDINLTLHSGEVIILKGPSGSGKTTLLTLIGGLRSAQSGSLEVLGEGLVGVSKEKLVKIRKNIGYIFQAHNLLESLTARQNVQMSLELHKGIKSPEVKQRAIALLESVGLGEHADYYPHNLSGGQKQRVAIARALVSHPKMVLADEPTAALDSKSGRNIVKLMQELAREQGCTILIVTHDNRILDVADRIVELEDGRITAKSSCF